VTAIRPFGDAALQVTLGAADDPTTLTRVHALAHQVAARQATGEPWGAAVPGLTSVLVPFEMGAWSSTEATARLSDLLGDLVVDPGPTPATRTHRIPVRYGGDDGPDLADVARRLGLSPERVIELHASVGYRVAILGFTPGFGYLDGLPEGLRLPRRDTPRTRVPAGSLAIAGRQTAIYPASTPGGWHLLGRTSARLWDIQRDPPALLRPGDLVRFEPVG
jgi:KipI family sensor histidine kinase inhibitor